MKSFGRFFDSSLSDDAQLVVRGDGKDKNRQLSRGHGQQGGLSLASGNPCGGRLLLESRGKWRRGDSRMHQSSITGKTRPVDQLGGAREKEDELERIMEDGG